MFLGKDGFTWFIGVVEDRNDPVKLGRVRVRCYGWHTEDKTEIPTEALPWAVPMNNTNSASVSGYGDSPTGMYEGTWVVGFFLDGDRAQEPVVMGTLPGAPSERANTSVGFNDPSGKYPIYTDESDVNRRAINNPEKPHPINEPKSNKTEIGIDCANGVYQWDELDIPLEAQYPTSHVRETESGHIKEYDDTGGSERIMEYHTAGTFYEIDKDGNKVTRIVGDNYEVIHKDNNVYIKGSCHITIDSNATTYIKGNWNIQVDGNKIENIKGYNQVHVNGYKKETVDGDWQRDSGTHIADNAPKIDHN